MLRLRYGVRVLTLLCGGLALLTGPGWAQGPPARPHATLWPFQSDAELVGYLRAVRADEERRRRAAEHCAARAPTVRTTSLPENAPGSAIIRGRVTDAVGLPVVSAQVLVQELGIGALTTASGQYRLAIPAEPLRAARARRVILRVRMIGYRPAQHALRLSARDSVELDFTLCASATTLAEATVEGGVATGFQAQERITNTQHEGMDEGGIVKLHGDYLVILRRGRLFTVAVGGNEGDSDLRPVAAVDAFGPDIDPRHTWYDELLVSGDKVAVIGYSYERGGTEIGVFRIDRRGGLTYLATYQLRSNDYYSSRNYASRLIGTKLVFYAPLYLWYHSGDLFAAFPAIRRWSRRAGDSAFKRIVPAQRIYRTPEPVTGFDLALHTVTTCDLTTEDLECTATAVLGPSSRVFYVSPEAVYVWVSSWSYRDRGESRPATLYRMPLDASAPSALGVSGSPVDQFSFLESEEGHLNVLVRSDARGDAMWGPETSAGEVALLRVPVESFGDGTDRAPWWRYHRLPAPAGFILHNRFVGDHLLYGVGSGWGRPQGGVANLYVVRWRDAEVTRIDLPHGVDRIEAMSSDALLVGADAQNLHFTGVRLDGAPEVAQPYTMPGASQGELRSHGFFYRADGPDSGVLGLPVRGPGRPGYWHLIRGSAGIVLLRNADRSFEPLGVLQASDEKPGNDGCRASCVDWYGNARPLFFRGRIVALLGFELVEGRIVAGEIREVRRVSYAPGVASVVRQ